MPVEQDQRRKRAVFVAFIADVQRDAIDDDELRWGLGVLCAQGFKRWVPQAQLEGAKNRDKGRRRGQPG